MFSIKHCLVVTLQIMFVGMMVDTRQAKVVTSKATEASSSHGKSIKGKEKASEKPTKRKTPETAVESQGQTQAEPER